VLVKQHLMVKIDPLHCSVDINDNKKVVYYCLQDSNN
jgi:hypothetical protein